MDVSSDEEMVRDEEVLVQDEGENDERYAAKLDTLEKVLQVNQLAVLRIITARDDPFDLLGNFRISLKTPSIMTEEFAGLATGMGVYKEILTAGSQYIPGRNTDLHICYACTDPSKASIASSAHRSPTRPLHCFEDVMDRVSAETRTAIDAIESQHLQMYSELKLMLHGSEDVPPAIGNFTNN